VWNVLGRHAPQMVGGAQLRGGLPAQHLHAVVAFLAAASLGAAAGERVGRTNRVTPDEAESP
jgi:hypothetical protein